MPFPIQLSSLSFPFFFSLLGFYVGNIFPTTLGLFPDFLPWKYGFPFLFVLFYEGLGLFFFRINRLKLVKIIFLFIETSFRKILKIFLSFLSDFPVITSFFINATDKKKYKPGQFLEQVSLSFRCFQFGILFGFFVDAFKVGS